MTEEELISIIEEAEEDGGLDKGESVEGLLPEAVMEYIKDLG